MFNVPLSSLRKVELQGKKDVVKRRSEFTVSRWRSRVGGLTPIPSRGGCSSHRCPYGRKSEKSAIGNKRDTCTRIPLYPSILGNLN